MLRTMIDRLARVIEGGSVIPASTPPPEPSTPYDMPPNVPVVGMLLAPAHDDTRFYTVLEVHLSAPTEANMPSRTPRLKLELLKILDNKKISTVWFDSPEIFWRYYVEK
jgi:hypothetical protein